MKPEVFKKLKPNQIVGIGPKLGMFYKFSDSTKEVGDFWYLESGRITKKSPWQVHFFKRKRKLSKKEKKNFNSFSDFLFLQKTKKMWKKSAIELLGGLDG